jgi:hypothetical protein
LVSRRLPSIALIVAAAGAGIAHVDPILILAAAAAVDAPRLRARLTAAPPVNR